MTQRLGFGPVWKVGLLAMMIGMAEPATNAQATKQAVPAQGAPASLEQPDAHRVKEELTRLLQGYPPSLRSTLALDASLLSNQQFLAPYPALAKYLNSHPEIVRNPEFFVGSGPGIRQRESPNPAMETVRDVARGIGVFAGFGMAIGVVVWLIRTVVDYRRWSRLAKVQTDAHTKLLDRFSANEDLLRYIQSPAGSRFLESSPIRLDAGPREVGAPLGRILWSVQGGVVLIAVGVGLQIVSAQAGDEGGRVLNSFGVLAAAAGIGFVVSAAISYLISNRLGLIERAVTNPPVEAARDESMGGGR